MSNNKFSPTFVLYESRYVGTEIGLDKAVEDAKHFKVPIAVNRQADNDLVKARYPDMDIIRKGGESNE